MSERGQYVNSLKRAQEAMYRIYMCARRNLQYVFKRVCTYNGIYANAPVIQKASSQESL
jgi:hypothetical protein